MIQDLKPYPAYKDSGVPWVGNIPAHWACLRGKALFVESQLQVRDSDEIVTCFRDGQVTLRRNRRSSGFMIALKEAGYQGVRKGQLVIHAMDAFAGAVGVSESDGKCTPEYIVCNPRRPDDMPEYFASVLRLAAQSKFIEVACQAVRERAPRLRYPDFGSLQLPVPTSVEQIAIVRYLNYVDGRIRRYIGAKKKLIALLNEQKQAIIHRAVTRGLDPNVRLKPSGLECLGDVPIHWEIRRLRTLVDRIEQGVSPQAETGLAEDGSWGVLKSGCVNRGIFRDTEHKRLPRDFPMDSCLAVKIGDVLVSRACGSPSLVGSAGRITQLRYQLVLSDKTFRPVFKNPGLIDFMVAAMNTRYYRVQVEQALSGADGLANNLPLSSLKDFKFAIPPEPDAERIASFLREQTRGVDTAMVSANREMVLLDEYRTRLIADVVTGNLDVREATAQLPEETDDSEPLADALVGGDDADLDVDSEEVDA